MADAPWGSDIDAALRVLRPEYRQLLRRAVSVFAQDQRVRGMWLHGAIARGALDEGSDLDIDIAVRDEDFEPFASGWSGWLALITPTVSAIPISGMPGSFYALTPTCERIDVVTERASALDSSPLTRRLKVFDHDGLSERVARVSDPLPDVGMMRFFVEETLRQAANFPTVVVRREWLLGVVAVQQIHHYLYLLFSEANKPQPPTGPKQWSFKLASRHRELLEALPVPQPQLESILDARRAALRLLVTEGRAVLARCDGEWPEALASAVLAYLAREGYAIGSGGPTS